MILKTPAQGAYTPDVGETLIYQITREVIPWMYTVLVTVLTIWT